MTDVRGVEQVRVSNWLSTHVSGAVAPFSFDLIAGGRSNLTYKVTGADGRRFVLRRPPMGNVLATAHDMGREHRIISAVGKTSVPVAPALGMCTDELVNGAPFYVMGYVEGLVLASPEGGCELPDRHTRGSSCGRSRRNRPGGTWETRGLYRASTEEVVDPMGEVEGA